MHNNRRIYFVLTTIICLLFIALGGLAQANQPQAEEVKYWLEQVYVAPLNEEQQSQTTVEGLLESLNDPYTSYLTPREFDNFMDNLEGSFGGIGIHIEQVEGYVTVVAPMDGTPAFQAGLKPRDRIVQINGLDVVGVPLNQVVDLIRGEPGTKVTLTILRQEERLQVELVRAIIEIKSVTSSMETDSIGYIRIATFGEKTAVELARHIKELQQAGARAFVLDLRYNGGGLLNVAIDMAEMLLPPNSPVVHTVDRTGRMRTYGTRNSTAQATLLEKEPVVVLINKGSASAAEILAAAIQENQRGRLVGEISFGKASVQTMVPLSDGGFLKVTTARYLTPLLNDINGVGITPDAVVEEFEQQLPKALVILEQELKTLERGYQRHLLLKLGSASAQLNGVATELQELPFVANNRTYVPVRFVTEKLGLEIKWMAETNQVYIRDKGQQLLLEPGKSYAFRNQEKVPGDAPVIMKDARTYLPVRFLVELLGGKVDFNPATQEINIWK